MLEMRKNKMHTHAILGEKIQKIWKIKIRLIQDRVTMLGWQEASRKTSTRLKTRLRKMMMRDMGKLRNYLGLRIAHNFLIY